MTQPGSLLLLITAIAAAGPGCKRADDRAPAPAAATAPAATPAIAQAPALGATVAPASGWPSQSIFHSSTRWQTDHAAEISLSALAGAPSVVAMVFTSCRASCPVMMADLQRLEAELSEAERAGMRFVVVSFDAANDTPQTLRAFAEEHRVDPRRWTFLHGDEAAVRELAALLEVRYAKLPQGGFDHANVINVLDAEGAILHRQEGLGQPVAPAVTRLREFLRRAGAGS